MSSLGRNPFETPAELRQPARRLRGHLPAPVTVWTAEADATGPVGLTVSSLVVADGDPSTVIGLIGPMTALWAAIEENKRFVVHVLGAREQALADLFAGHDPGDPFDGLATNLSPWGPVIEGVASHAACRLVGFMEAGYALLVRGEIERVDIGEPKGGPLAYYRGRYRGLAQE